MATINLRNVPAELHRRAKAVAAFRGQTLKEFMLDCIRQKVHEETRRIRAADGYKEK